MSFNAKPKEKPFKGLLIYVDLEEVGVLFLSFDLQRITQQNADKLNEWVENPTQK